MHLHKIALIKILDLRQIQRHHSGRLRWRTRICAVSRTGVSLGSSHADQVAYTPNDEKRPADPAYPIAPW